MLHRTSVSFFFHSLSQPKTELAPHCDDYTVDILQQSNKDNGLQWHDNLKYYTILSELYKDRTTLM